MDFLEEIDFNNKEIILIKKNEKKLENLYYELYNSIKNKKDKEKILKLFKKNEKINFSNSNPILKKKKNNILNKMEDKINELENKILFQKKNIKNLKNEIKLIEEEKI